jgi:outer membrane immunogenic protein
MRKYLLAALVAGAVATPALAQDDRPPFTGVRVEGIVGYDRADANPHTNGVLYGVGAGFDFQTGGAVLGVEGEFSDSTADRCVTGLGVAGDRTCAKAGRDFYAGGRVGGVVGSNTLLYAKAGYTNARINADYTGVAGGPASFSLHEDLDGVRVGGGVEHAVGRNAFVKAEYRYSNYEAGAERHQAVVGFGFRF